MQLNVSPIQHCRLAGRGHFNGVHYAVSHFYWPQRPESSHASRLLSAMNNTDLLYPSSAIRLSSSTFYAYCKRFLGLISSKLL